MRSITHIFPAIFIGFCFRLWSCDIVSGDQDANANRTSCLCYIACQLSDDCCTADCQHANSSCSSCLEKCLQNTHPWELKITSNAGDMEEEEGACCPETAILTLPSMAAFFKIIKHKYFINNLIPTCPSKINISLHKQLCQKSGNRSINPTVATIKCSETHCNEHFEEETIKNCEVFPELCCSARYVSEIHNLRTLDKEEFSKTEQSLKKLEKRQVEMNNTMSCHRRFSVSSDVKFLKICAKTTSVYNYIIHGFSLLSLICIVIIFILHRVFPQFRKTHGLCLLSLCAALFVTISTGRIQVLLKTIIGKLVMLLLNSLKMYTWLSVYTWQMLMSINLYQAFRRMEVNTMTKTTKVKDSHIYSVIGWCVPLPFIITGISVPGLKMCFDNGGIVVCLTNTKFIFVFTVPVACMILVGVFCIIYTLTRMKQIQSGSTNTTQNGWILPVVLRLQLLLGIPWIALIVVSVTLIDEFKINVIKVIDIVDSLQGVFIFIAFVTTKGVRFTLVERFGRKKRSDRNNLTSITSASPKLERRRYSLIETEAKKKEESML
ncbi:G-protein coupled receptor Mth2 [Holothuria leucospilota]|uniref:G-protein coupled receptor Mth2 n=1 Tax=Holothuria leucospilota TaxID=206669 RepID=A0A9Q1BRZ5_HOLLE|nr:G-protein coupled receptor Mth2 [Holothuria leucospilota]